MSENVVERRNKFPNPRFSMSGTRPLWWTDKAQHITYNGDDQLAVVRLNTDDSVPSPMWPIKLEPGQKYHFQCNVWHNIPSRGVVLSMGPDNHTYNTTVLDDGIKDTRNGGLLSADFTATEANPWLLVLFYAAETVDADSSGVHYWQPLLDSRPRMMLL